MEYSKKKNDNIVYLPNDIVHYKNTDSYTHLSLFDYDGFNNGDILKIDRNYYVLLGNYLYCLNNKMMIEANPTLLKKVKKVSIVDYIKEKEHYEYKSYDGLFNDEIKEDNNILKDLFKMAYYRVIYNDALDQMDFNEDDRLVDIDTASKASMTISRLFFGHTICNPNSLTFRDGEMGWFQNEDYRESGTFNQDIIKSLDNSYDLTGLKEKIDKELEKRQIDEHGKFIYEEKKEINKDKINKKKEEFSKFDFDEIYEKIINDVDNEVFQELVSGIWIIKNFMYNYPLNGKVENNNPGEDYTFLIVNFVKATEVYLYNKMKKIDSTISPLSMLGDLIDKISQNESKYLKNNTSKDKFITACNDIRKKARNGYFHKHRLTSFKDADEIIVICIQFLIRAEIYMK